MAVVLSQNPPISPTLLNHLLKKNGASLPFLSTYKVMPFILTSWAIAAGICLIIVITVYLIPAIAAFLFIPLILLLMLLLGAAFVYRFFGHKLPFVSSQFQIAYVASYNTASLIIGLLFITAFVVSLIVILTRQQRIKFIHSMLKLSKICFWDNIYILAVSLFLSALSIGLMFLNIYAITLSISSANSTTVTYNWPFIIVVLI